MCGSALFGKPPKPIAPAQFQEAKSPEYDARGRSGQRENRRRGYSATILAALNKNPMQPRTTATAEPTTLGVPTWRGGY